MTTKTTKKTVTADVEKGLAKPSTKKSPSKRTTMAANKKRLIIVGVAALALVLLAVVGGLVFWKTQKQQKGGVTPSQHTPGQPTSGNPPPLFEALLENPIHGLTIAVTHYRMQTAIVGTIIAAVLIAVVVTVVILVIKHVKEVEEKRLIEEQNESDRKKSEQFDKMNPLMLLFKEPGEFFARYTGGFVGVLIGVVVVIVIVVVVAVMLRNPSNQKKNNNKNDNPANKSNQKKINSNNEAAEKGHKTALWTEINNLYNKFKANAISKPLINAFTDSGIEGVDVEVLSSEKKFWIKNMHTNKSLKILNEELAHKPKRAILFAFKLLDDSTWDDNDMLPPWSDIPSGYVPFVLDLDRDNVDDFTVAMFGRVSDYLKAML